MGHSPQNTLMNKRILLMVVILICAGPQLSAWGAGSGLMQYTDPKRRFIFDYPATMKVHASDPNEVRISHPEASLRIAVFVQKRQAKSKPSAESLLATFKSKLKEEIKDVQFLEQGKSPSIQGAQGYIICAFKNAKGAKMVQLVQYYIADEFLLQLTISDRPEGFKNLAPLITKIHHSLRIINPDLK